jgi:glycosyltransferase involved in cell wall biosynthesis
MALRIFVVHPSRLLTDHQPHGDGLLAYRYVKELAARGHHITIACEQVDLLEAPPMKVELHSRPVAGAHASSLWRAQYAWWVRSLFRRLHAQRPFDLAHQLNPVFSGLSLGLAGSGVPLVLGPYVPHWPQDRVAGIKGLGLDLLVRLQQSAAEAAVVASETARRRILDRRLRERGTFLVPYGIDLDAFPASPMPQGDPTIAFVGSLEERKGVFVLLDAFTYVAERNHRVRLCIAGGGDAGGRVAEVVRGNRYRDRIALLGVLPRADVARLLREATVYCLPSFGEPYGMGIVEAMATGRPVVATALGGPSDLVDARGGRLVRAGDAQRLAEALLEVLASPGLAAAMGEHNRRAARSFAWTNVIDGIEAVYAAALAPRAVPA